MVQLFDTISEFALRAGVKPFCPVHHWRMSAGAGTQLSPSFECNYDGCTVMYTPELGYFEADKKGSHKEFFRSVEGIICRNHAEHHVCIVGYSRDSFGQHTEEWRHWQCGIGDCDFSWRQKLSGAVSASQLFKLPRNQNVLSCWGR